ncbi:MAG: hypothetical protein RBG13Loki_3784, partial [Promethearchaeota archaeon CR_4]
MANLPPVANPPADIITTTTGMSTIDWVLTDNQGSGQYREIVNEPSSEFYTWVNSTAWEKNVAL